LKISFKYRTDFFKIATTTIVFIIILSFLSHRVLSTDLPPILKYLPQEYKAGNQNWQISQDKDNLMYFANNEGLLEFNGAEWTLYPSPNETIIRAVKIIGNRVYTGCFMEFGYWVREKQGKLKYKSLSANIKKSLLPDEHIWDIQSYENWVLFQSLYRIYLYDTKNNKFRIIDEKNGIWRTFVSDNNIFFQSLNEGFYEIKKGVPILINDNSVFKNYRICNILNRKNERLVQTEKEGLFIFKDKIIKKYSGKNSDVFNRNDIFSCIMTADSNIILGTISNGIYIVSPTFDIIHHISQNSGLSNNTVLSLFEDNDRNIWIGLDNGINCLNTYSAFECYTDKSGFLGTIYTASLFKGNLYLGTNQGLFYKKYTSNEEFKLISGTKGQVWTLIEYDNQLFCGHNRGTLLIEGSRAVNIFSNSGTWKFNPDVSDKNVLYQGNYDGISVLKKVDSKWKYSHKLSNFNISARYFELDNLKNIYVSHEYKGLIRLKTDAQISKVEKVEFYTEPKTSKYSGLIKFNNHIYYLSKNGFFKLDQKTLKFNKDIFFNKYFEKGQYLSGKLYIDKFKQLWIFTKTGLEFYTGNNIDSDVKKGILYINSDLLKPISGFENISQLEDNKYLIGTTDGYDIIHKDKIVYQKGKIKINLLSASENNIEFRPISLDGPIKFNYKTNNIEFSFSIPKYNKLIPSEYQYFLEAYSNEWSEWGNISKVTFRKLPSGKYKFIVRGKNGHGSTLSTDQIEFTINNPFYLTIYAFLIYFLLIILIAYIINKVYHIRYTKQKNKLIEEHKLVMEIQKLETEQQLIKLKNIELALDVDEKNKELAISTLDNLRKNELLTIIKNDLKKNSNPSNLQKLNSLISEINENISGKDSWSVFKQSFDSIDKDFLKKFHVAHPNLTPNDLKLCAYLRLNLSSKEIAPIFNISTSSIEIKRYRIRKKLNLPHGGSLVNYIINF
jgi:ligand-binding sensor domain-containing protein/DNA-binding CsgD family transcriptional regulator